MSDPWVHRASCRVRLVSDPGLWNQTELDNAYVIHRMIVPQAAAGRGIGDVLLAHAATLARSNGKSRLILDAWTSNAQLHAYCKKGLSARSNSPELLDAQFCTLRA